MRNFSRTSGSKSAAINKLYSKLLKRDITKIKEGKYYSKKPESKSRRKNSEFTFEGDESVEENEEKVVESEENVIDSQRRSAGKRKKLNDGEVVMVGGEKPKKRRGSLKPASERKKRIPKPLVFKLGKANPDVEILEKEKTRTSEEVGLLYECCTPCNNHNFFRAVRTDNTKLVSYLLGTMRKISSIYQAWGPEVDYSAVEIAIRSNKIDMLEELLKIQLKQHYELGTAKSFSTTYANTGRVSKKAFGVRTRKVQISRGNRQGNNALLEDNNSSSGNLNIQYFLQSDSFLKRLFYYPEIEVETLKKLIIMGKDFSYEENLVQSIKYATRAGNLELSSFLVGKVYTQPNYGFNNLHYDVLRLNDPLELKTFPKVSVTKRCISNDRITPLHFACINPNEKILEALLKLDPDINTTDDQMMKPVHYAAACEGTGPLKLLHETGATLNDANNEKITPLMCAVFANRPDNVSNID